MRRNGDWLSARIGDEIVMMSVEKGHYLGLSEVGSRIWELLETPTDTEAICQALEREFAVDPATCRREVAAFLTELEAHGAVASDPS